MWTHTIPRHDADFIPRAPKYEEISLKKQNVNLWDTINGGYKKRRNLFFIFVIQLFELLELLKNSVENFWNFK